MRNSWRQQHPETSFDGRAEQVTSRRQAPLESLLATEPTGVESQDAAAGAGIPAPGG